MTKTVELLYEQGFIYKPNQPKITKGQLEHLLKNPFYYGMIRFKEHLFRGVHEPLVSKELFDKVQIAFKKDNKPHYVNKHDFAFAGMLTCGECGCTITAELKKGRYIYYHCTGGKGECEQKSKYIPQDKLEEMFDEAAKRVSITTEHRHFWVQGLKESFGNAKEFNQERINSLNQQKERIKERLEKLYIDKLDGKITERFWEEKHNQWNNELDTIIRLLAAHEKTTARAMEEGVRILELLENFYREYSGESPMEKAEMLKIIIERQLN